ncbi:hypothetical protein IDVR_13780 [Intrasporangium sp. DVR]
MGSGSTGPGANAAWLSLQWLAQLRAATVDWPSTCTVTHRGSHDKDSPCHPLVGARDPVITEGHLGRSGRGDH